MAATLRGSVAAMLTRRRAKFSARSRRLVGVFGLALLCTSACSTTSAPAVPLSGSAPPPPAVSSSAPLPSQTHDLRQEPAATAVAVEPESEPPIAAEQTRTGAGVLVDNGFAALNGRRIALISHRASIVDGRRLIDLIDEQPDVQLVALFAPEHGLDGVGAAGENLEDGIETKTGLPVFSLYGTSRSPANGTLDGVDMLVYDLQDVGTRFFTYTSTLGLSMQAAADAGIPFVVLDRPNPLGGATFQGPSLAPGSESFIGLYPIPSAYGLTSGELAMLIKQEQLLPGLEELELMVVPIANWSRDFRWNDTELPWIAPSPNLPTVDAALIYPGTVLFEATSISEGRGTDEPFQLIGAPWLDSQLVTADLNQRGLPGVVFEAASFTPRSIPEAAPAPRYLGQQLHGVRIHVTDPSIVAGLDVGLHVLDAVLRQADSAGVDLASIIDRPEFFDRLAGVATVRTGLLAGADVEQIIESFAADHAAFTELVDDVLLYD